MKKLFTLLVVMTTIVCGLNAEVLLKDSFARDLGNLHSGTAQDDMGTNTTNWYTGSTGTKYFQVVDTSLTFAGYQTTKAGRAVENDGSSVSVVRAFSSAKSSGSVYLSCIIRMKNPTRNSSTSPSIVPILSMGSGIASSKQFGKILYQPSGAGFKVAPGKYTESATYLRWSKELEVNKEYLLILRYDFVEGTRNDSVFLWINPKKTDIGNPTIIQKKDTTTDKGNAAGTNTRDDAASLGYAWITSGSFAPKDIIVDEVRVATTWAELFEGGGGDEPELGISPTSVAAGYIFQGEQVAKTIDVTGQKLAEDVTISNTNAEISLSTAKITKAAAEAGASFTATIKANAVGDQKDTITLTSGTIIKKIPVAWSTVGVANCANIKALKDSVNGLEGWTKYVRLTGEAIVTRDTTISSTRELYIEDATGAAKITDEYSALDATNLVGAKIKNLMLLNGEGALGIQPFVAQGKPTIVSTGNEPTVQVVTLAELQANAADYLLELIKVNKVTFTDGGGTFTGGQQYEITQDSKTAKVKVEMTRGILGTIPTIANVIGFSTSVSASIIVPRGPEDIIEADPAMLKNGSFEKYSPQSSPFGSGYQFDDWRVSSIFANMINVENTDVLEGNAAFKTTSEVSTGYIYQDINCENYIENDTFSVRINYKNLNNIDGALTLDCGWLANIGSDPIAQTAEMKQALPYSADWSKVTFRVSKPAGAKYFQLKIKIKSKSQVLFDDFAFDFVEPTEPYFAVTPSKSSYSFTTNINTDTVVAELTITKYNMTQPVELAWGSATDKTIYSAEKTSVTDAEETVRVKFKASAVGKYKGSLSINGDKAGATKYNTNISFEGTAVDPTKKPEVIITPTTFNTFRCKAYETATDTFVVSSSNCTDWVHVVIDDETGPKWAFSISDSYFIKNSTDTVIITFAPKAEGDYTATLKAYTTGIDTIWFNVSGHADPGEPTPVVVDWDTAFNWNATKVYSVLNEQFNHADTCRNKTLKTTDWQNVVLTGQRPWWGYKTDTTKQAKITSYYSYEEPGSMKMESWLVTPALDYKNAPSQIFTFNVMGEFMQEDQTAKLEVYYIDASNPKDVFFQHIEDIDSLIPAKNSDLNGNWYYVELNLTGQQNISDVFYMAFKFTDEGGTNGIVYYVDDVTWGVKGASGMVNVNANRMSDVHKFVYNGKLLIEINGKRYNVFGQLQ